MKMPEKHDLLAAILAAKEQGIGAILAFAMAYLRDRYNGGAFTKTVIGAAMYALSLIQLMTILDLTGLNGKSNLLTACFSCISGKMINAYQTLRC